MKLKEAIVLILIVGLIAALGTVLASFTYTHWYFLDETTIPVKFKVSEGAALGFDLNNSVLALGIVPQGQLARREIYLNAVVPATAYISVEPPLDDWLHPTEATVKITPGQETEVTMELALPEDAPPGNYTGNITIQYFRRLG